MTKKKAFFAISEKEMNEGNESSDKLDKLDDHSSSPAEDWVKENTF